MQTQKGMAHHETQAQGGASGAQATLAQSWVCGRNKSLGRANGFEDRQKIAETETAPTLNRRIQTHVCIAASIGRCRIQRSACFGLGCLARALDLKFSTEASWGQ